MKFIGVDPGLTGAICLLDSRGLIECEDLPACENGTASGSMRRWIDWMALDVLLAGWSVRHSFAQDSVHGFIERPIPMPSLPAQTIASQFDTFGVVRALVARRCEVLTLLNPRDWKKTFGLGQEKGASRATCQALYPDAPVTRVKDHNRAESILIAHHGMRSVE